MIEEALRYLGVISRANTIIAISLGIITGLMLLFYITYIMKDI